MAREKYINPGTFVILKVAGVVPTIPDPPTLRRYHKDFADNNLEIGEFARNIADGKLFFRNETAIVETADDLFGPDSVYHNHDDRYFTETESDARYVQIGGPDPIDLSEWFELVNPGLENEYLRCKKPFGCDYEVSAWTDSGQFPGSVWDGMPYATDAAIGGIIYDSTVFEKNVSDQLTIKSGVLVPAAHTHDDRYFTETETNTQISNAIAAFVDSAPATLDTINELAAALGDDPNFATTVTNLIATKAPINNPTFTGTVTIGAYHATNKIRFGGDDNHYISYEGTTPDRVIVQGYQGVKLNNAYTGAYLILGNTAVDTNVSINSTGEVTAFYSSDRRLKKNIKSFKALDIIKRLNPVSFQWNEKAKKLNSHKDDSINYSFIAQEMEEVLPSLVHPIYNKYKGIEDRQIISILVQAVKEQQAQINKLRNGN